MPASASTASTIAIRLPRTLGERQAAFRLRYCVYVEEYGFPQPCADHRTRTVEDALDQSATLLVAMDGDAVVGTVRSNFGPDSDFGIFSSLHRMHELGHLYPSKVSLTSKLIVHKQYRTGKIALALSRTIFKIAVKHGIAVDFIDCQPKLIPLYRRLGYQQTQAIPFEHPELGPRIPMRLWTDHAYLQRADSLLLKEPA